MWLALALLVTVALGAAQAVDFTGLYVQESMLEKHAGLTPTVLLYEHPSSSEPFAVWDHSHMAMIQRGMWVLIKPGILGVRDVRAVGGYADRIIPLQWNDYLGGVRFDSSNLKVGEYMFSVWCDQRDGERRYILGLIHEHFTQRDENGVLISIVDRTEPLTLAAKTCLAQSSGFISLKEIPEEMPARTTIKIASIALWAPNDSSLDPDIRRGAVVIDRPFVISVQLGEGEGQVLRYALRGENMEFGEAPGWIADGGGGIYQETSTKTISIKPWFPGAHAQLTVTAGDGRGHWGKPAVVQITVRGDA